MPRRQLILAVLVQILVLSVWFSTAAVVPSLAAEWRISSGATGWLTTAVQVGFVVGALGAAALNLPDRFRLPWLMAGASALAAASTAAIPAFADGLASAIGFRLITGVALAGAYPVATKLVVSWFAEARPLAMGLLLAALTLGSALPHLVNAFADLPWRAVLVVTSGLALIGAAISLFLVEGPLTTSRSELHPRYLLRMFSEPDQRRINFGYFGHMWELYALWTWLPSFLAATAAFADVGSTERELMSFAAIGLAGAAGCVAAGLFTRRHQPLDLARMALLLSGLCCAVTPLVFGAPTIVLILVLVLWGAAVIADSPMFSTALSNVADKRYVGTALTCQMAIGFLLTAVSIRVLPLFEDAVGWRWALLLLLPGPLLGLLAIDRGRGPGRRPYAAVASRISEESSSGSIWRES